MRIYTKNIIDRLQDVGNPSHSMYIYIIATDNVYLI